MWCSSVPRWSLLCVVVSLYIHVHITQDEIILHRCTSSLVLPAPSHTYSVPHILACTSSCSYIPSISITHAPSVPLLVTHLLPSSHSPKTAVYFTWCMEYQRMRTLLPMASSQSWRQDFHQSFLSLEWIMPTTATNVSFHPQHDILWLYCNG